LEIDEASDTGHSETMNRKAPNTVSIYYTLFLIFLAATAVSAGIIIFYGVSSVLFAVTEIALLLSMSLYILYKKFHYTDAVEMINTTAANIEDTQLQLVAFNEHLQALNDFSKKLSESTDQTEICKLVTGILVNEFKYDSSQLWLLNPFKNCLECISISGHTDSITQQFMRDGGAGTGQQLLNQVHIQKRMLIVRDIDNHIGKEETNIFLFSKFFNLTSFAVIPLLVEDRALGVLTAEYHRGKTMDAKENHSIEIPAPPHRIAAKDETKRFDEKDCLLLESITNFVRDVLVKTELFFDMEHQIEERTQELTRINDKLLRTREMAIQSEKLSSLGRMAAGVIHEINESLNFLINILPDLRRDLQGLEKVNHLTKECVTDPNIVSELEEICAHYDLESHLQEMDFVFNRVANALNKSARISGSLNIFTSSPRQEETEFANLLEVAQDTIDMIPKNVLGETKISVSGDEDCTWLVNRSEMQQVIFNLVNNAVDAMEKNGTVEIWGEKKKHAVVLSICDTGPGIPTKIQNQIFDPFFTTKPTGQGTGLGLSISAEIVRKFGGNLTVESVEGQGTCFHIRLSEET
jgi:signal transduction histidine kinase